MRFVIEIPFASESLNVLMGWKHNTSTRLWKYVKHRESVKA